MLKLVAPVLILALFAGAVLAGPASVMVRMRTLEVASACKFAPGFGSAKLWQQALGRDGDTDEDAYVREVFSDARSVHSAVARFKAELQDRALAEVAAKQNFVPGRLTLSGCAIYAAIEPNDGVASDAIFPTLKLP